MNSVALDSIGVDSIGVDSIGVDSVEMGKSPILDGMLIRKRNDA